MVTWRFLETNVVTWRNKCIALGFFEMNMVPWIQEMNIMAWEIFQNKCGDMDISGNQHGDMEVS